MKLEDLRAAMQVTKDVSDDELDLAMLVRQVVRSQPFLDWLVEQDSSSALSSWASPQDGERRALVEGRSDRELALAWASEMEAKEIRRRHEVRMQRREVFGDGPR